MFHLKNKLLYRLAAAGLACSLLCSPVSALAAETGETAEDVGRTVYEKTVDSNTWENW